MSEEKKLREHIDQALKKALKPFIGKPIDGDLIQNNVEKALLAELSLLLGDTPIPPFHVVHMGDDRFHIVFGCKEEKVPEKKIVNLEMYETIGIAVPHVMPVRKYPVHASGRCKVCDKEIIIIDTGCFHLNGDEVDTGGAAGHAPRMYYRDLFRDVVHEAMEPFIGVTAITGPNVEKMRVTVEGACYNKLREWVGVHPINKNPFPMVNAHYSPPNQINITFTPEDFIPFGEPTNEQEKHQDATTSPGVENA